MSMIANGLMMKELTAALAALDTPFNLLPNDLKDKNGNTITDVNEKRARLVRHHIGLASGILSLVENTQANAEAMIQSSLAQMYRQQIEAALGIPPATEECNCETCRSRREVLDVKPFGFASGIKKRD